MRALAELLIDLGWQVSGSDRQPPTPTIFAMQKRGLQVHQGHHDQYLPRDVDVLVHSPAVGPQNPERQRAEGLNIPVLSYSEMLGYLMQTRRGISIAGTHGKSTTSAMVASILTDAGLSPSVVIGAELCGSQRSGWAGRGDLFVVESCEYRRSFLDLRPQYAAVLGIEGDHFDYFCDLDDLRWAFDEFAARVADDGILLINADCRQAAALAETAKANVVTFSQNPGSHWWATDLRPTASGTRFRVFQQGEFFAECSLPMPGRHNVMNALAAIALSHYAGVSATKIREGLRDFPGVRRRFENIRSWRGMTLIDDYAHHPTAVRATLEMTRQQFGRRRIWCAFQPHQVSRTQALMKEFVASFAAVDEVLVAPIFAAREELDDEPETIGRELASRIADRGQNSRFCLSLDRVRSTLEDEARPGDVLITLGAGDVDRIHHELTRRLQQNHPRR